MNTVGELFNALPREIAHNITVGPGEAYEDNYHGHAGQDWMVYYAPGSHIRTAPTGGESRNNWIGGYNTRRGYWSAATGMTAVAASGPVEAIRAIWGRRQKEAGFVQEQRPAEAKGCSVCE